MQSTETLELLSDLIKIGIPSLVAIITTIIGAILTHKSYQKDMEIERLKISDSAKKDLKDRQGGLIQRIAGDLITIQVPLIKFGTAVSDDAKSDKTIKLLVEMNEMEISDTYEALKQSVSDGSKTKIDIYLLGSKELNTVYEDYWQALLVFINECNPYGGRDLTLEALHSRYYLVKSKQEGVLAVLSKMYLGNNYGVPSEL